MSVTSVDTDYENLTITLIADFDAAIDQVWKLWSDPRRLERWLGPPTHPASVEKHDLTPGGEVTFFMTGPHGDRSWGTWRVTAVDPPTSLEFTDAFADADGTPIADMPVSTVTVQLTERGAGTRMQVHSAFESRDDMDKWVSMGTLEGLQQAVGQMDVLLAA
jgi:uncharacterized protein YndB with AHSA1/START domain